MIQMLFYFHSFFATVIVKCTPVINYNDKKNLINFLIINLKYYVSIHSVVILISLKPRQLY